MISAGFTFILFVYTPYLTSVLGGYVGCTERIRKSPEGRQTVGGVLSQGGESPTFRVFYHGRTTRCVGNYGYYYPVKYSFAGCEAGFVTRVVQVNYKLDGRLIYDVKMGMLERNSLLLLSLHPFSDFCKKYTLTTVPLTIPLYILYIYIYKNIFIILYIYYIRECKPLFSLVVKKRWPGKQIKLIGLLVVLECDKP